MHLLFLFDFERSLCLIYEEVIIRSLLQFFLLLALKFPLLGSREDRNWSSVEFLNVCLEDLISLCDEGGELNLDFWADDHGSRLDFPLVPEFGDFVGGNDLLDVSVLEDFKLLRAADTATEREDATLAWILAGRRVSDAKWAVDAVAVLEGRVEGAVVLIVAWLAHIVSTEAAEESGGAAVHAFPVDLSFAVLFAVGGTGTDFLEEAVLAKKVFLLGIACVVGCFLLAVNETTEVGLLATSALVEGAAVVGVFLRLVVVDVIWVLKSLIGKDSLALCILEGLSLNLFLQGNQWSKLSGDGLGESLDLELLVAAWAGHEAEGDSESGPLVLEELHEAVGVEDVAAGKLGASL